MRIGRLDGPEPPWLRRRCSPAPCYPQRYPNPLASAMFSSRNGLVRCFNWCRLRDSNPRPPDYKSGALPTELSRPPRTRLWLICRTRGTVNGLRLSLSPEWDNHGMRVAGGLMLEGIFGLGSGAARAPRCCDGRGDLRVGAHADGCSKGCRPRPCSGRDRVRSGLLRRSTSVVHARRASAQEGRLVLQRTAAADGELPGADGGPKLLPAPRPLDARMVRLLRASLAELQPPYRHRRHAQRRQNVHLRHWRA